MRPGLRLRCEILTGVALIALVLWTVIALLLYQAHRQAIETATAAGRNVARGLAEFQDSSIRAIDLSLRQLRDAWMRDPASFDEAVARHEEHLHKERVIQVAVVDRDAWPLYSRLPQGARQNFSDRSYFQLQKERGTDELHVSEPVMGRITQQWAIQFTRPLFDAGRRFAGVIVVAVPPPALELVFEDIDLGAHGVITLARADGAILARTGGLAPAAQVSLAGVPGLGEAAPAAGEFRRTAKLDGVDRFFAYRRLQNYPLTLFVGQGASTVFASYYKQRDALLAAGVVASFLLGAVALLLVGRAQERAKAVEQREQLMLELHDGCIQSIYAIGLALENARRLMDRDPAQAAHALAESGANLNLVIQDLRAFISGVRRAPYTEDEFMAEVERIVPQAQASGPRFTVDIDRAIVPGLSTEEAAHVLRIAREAVSNILRHSNAKHARLSLRQRGAEVCLEVSDDGVGIPEQVEAQLGLGLHHIKARAQKLRGRARVEAAPNEGTRIAVEFRRHV